MKLAERFFSIKDRAPHHYFPTLICQFHKEIITATESTKGNRFNPGDVGPVRSFFEIESIERLIAVVHEEVRADELDWRRHPARWVAPQAREVILLVVTLCECMEKYTYSDAAHIPADISANSKSVAVGREIGEPKDFAEE